MCYVVISCEPRDGSARRIYVKHYQVDQVPSAVLEQSLREVRELCRATECEFEVYLRASPARWRSSQTFQASCNVYTITKDVAVLDDDVHGDRRALRR